MQATRLEGGDFFFAPQQIYHTDMPFATAFCLFRQLLVALLFGWFCLGCSQVYQLEFARVKCLCCSTRWDFSKIAAQSR